MRTTAAVALAIVSTCLGAGLVACFDLFHSTDDLLTACQLDAKTPGCVDAAPDGDLDFCTWTRQEARQNAEHTCAWLGACEIPIGRNAFGPCMFQALLAYDCAANPSHPVEGQTRDLWKCLARAQTCAAVHACVFPGGPQNCQTAEDYLTCATAPGNESVRVECTEADASAHGENCALWGQTCTNGGCAGSGPAGACSPGCDGTQLHYCDDAGDLGIDCADNGAGQCQPLDLPDAVAPAACIPQGDAGTCAPDASAQCTGGVATSCPTGVPETIDCEALLQAASACAPGPLSPPFDWTGPCVVPEDSGACVDTCNGNVVTGCARNAPVTVDCTSAPIGLGACEMYATDASPSRARCTPPPP